jgi:hypothetical protein
MPRRLIGLCPKSFRDRFGDRNRANVCGGNQIGGYPSFELLGSMDPSIIREHIAEFMLATAMSEMITNPKWAASGSSILCLPLLGTFLVPVLDIEPFLSWFKAAATVDGQQAFPLRFSRYCGLCRQPLSLPGRRSPGMFVPVKICSPTLSHCFSAAFMIPIAVFWIGLLNDQMPCFLCVPNCGGIETRPNRTLTDTMPF